MISINCFKDYFRRTESQDGWSQLPHRFRLGAPLFYPVTHDVSIAWCRAAGGHSRQFKPGGWAG
jgi:hypothetical protein